MRPTSGDFELRPRQVVSRIERNRSNNDLRVRRRRAQRLPYLDGVHEQPPSTPTNPSLAPQQLDRNAPLGPQRVPDTRVAAREAVQLSERRPIHQIDGKRCFSLHEVHHIGTRG